MSGDLVSKLLAQCRNKDRAAIRSRDVILTYRDLDLQTRRIAVALRQCGCAPGDKVGSILPKSLDAFLLFLGILRAGCVAVPINNAHPNDVVDRMCVASDVSLIIQDTNRDDKATLPCPNETLGVGGIGSFGDRIAAVDAEDYDTIDLPADAGALILFTSGTTGDPKAVVHSISSLFESARSLAKVWNMTQNDTVLHGLPISHAHGLVIAPLPVLYAGGTLLWMDVFEPRAVLKALPLATCFMGVPFHYQNILDCLDFAPSAFTGIRLCACGSAPLADTLAARFKTEAGVEIAQRYAMTETMVITANPPDDIRPGSVGRALEGTQMHVIDLKSEAHLSTGKIGEVVVQSPTLFDEYLNHDGAKDYTRDGFFRTGDLGRLDADGYLTLVGRSRDVVIYCGINVYPKDVEHEFERMDDVQEACVFGIPHPQTGESVIAAVVPTAGADVSPTALRQRLVASLAPYQVPKRVWVIEEVPRNALGKPIRSALVELYLSS